MARGFIPITKIWEWAQFYGFDKSETRALTYVITTVDRWKLEFESEHKPKD